MLDKKIGEYFGSVQEYRIARDIYWDAMTKSELTPLQTYVAPHDTVPQNASFTIPTEVHAYWLMYQWLMQEKYTRTLDNQRYETD
jgi:hypothetical protein